MVLSRTYVVLRIAPDLLAATATATELGVRRAPHFGIALGKDPAIRRAFERLAACVQDEDDVLEQQSRFSFGVRLLPEHCIEQPRAGCCRRVYGRPWWPRRSALPIKAI